MRTFLVNIGYGLNIVLLGLVGFTLTTDGSRTLALVIPLILGSLVVIMSWLTLQDQRNERLGKTGRLGVLIVPIIAAVTFLWMAGSASALEGQRARVLLYIAMTLISVQTLGQIWLLRDHEKPDRPADAS
ncbi:MAG: hypothetical protein KF724_05780 [Phycisphaeraceae bacterium]|nr:hypothetical protein [Phycisphaeraceae bacterium]